MREAKQISWHNIPVTKISRWISVAQEETSHTGIFSSCKRPRSMHYYPCMDSRISGQKSIFLKFLLYPNPQKRLVRKASEPYMSE